MSGSLFPFELTVDKLEHVNTNKPNGGKKKKSKLQENKGIVTKEQVKNSFFYIVKK